MLTLNDYVVGVTPFETAAAVAACSVLSGVDGKDVFGARVWFGVALKPLSYIGICISAVRNACDLCACTVQAAVHCIRCTMLLASLVRFANVAPPTAFLLTLHQLTPGDT